MPLGQVFPKGAEQLCSQKSIGKGKLKRILESDEEAQLASAALLAGGDSRKAYVADVAQTKARILYLESVGRFVEARRLACATNDPAEVRLTVLSGSPALAVRLLFRPSTRRTTTAPPPKFATYFLPIYKGFEKFAERAKELIVIGDCARRLGEEVEGSADAAFCFYS